MTRTRVRLFGYPFHPTLVVFPLALFPVSFLADAWAAFTHNAFAWRFALWTLVAGVVGTLAAVAVGLIEYRSVPSRARDLARRHRALGVTILLWYGLVLGLHGSPVTDARFVWTAVALNLVGQLLLAYQGVWGGWLVYKHRVGVDEGPSVTSHVICRNR